MVASLTPMALVRKSFAFAACVLLVPLAVPPTVAAEDYAPQTDKHGDVGVNPASIEGISVPVDVPIWGAFDLWEFGIYDEDEFGLRLYVEVANLTTPPPVARGNAVYDFVARLEGTRTFYRLQWHLTQDLPQLFEPIGGVWGVHLCVVQSDSMPTKWDACRLQEIQVTIDVAAARFQVYVTKEALRGRATLVPGSSAAPSDLVLEQGSRLTEMSLTARHMRLGMTLTQDRLPNAGNLPPYAFQDATANTLLRISPADVTEEPGKAVVVNPPVPVPVGATSTLLFRVENRAAEARRVETDVTISGAAWSLDAESVLTVPPRSSRELAVAVTPPADSLHRTGVLLQVVGRSVDGVGVTKLRLDANVPPGPEHPTLYFHVNANNLAYLNTLDEDPRGTKDDGFGMWVRPNATHNLVDLWFSQDMFIPEDLVLDTSRPVDVRLAFRSARQYEAEVRLELYTLHSQRPVAAGGHLAVLGDTEYPFGDLNIVNFSIPISAGATRIEAAEGGLLARVVVAEPYNPLLMVDGTTRPTIVPGESQMTMPFIEDG